MLRGNKTPTAHQKSVNPHLHTHMHAIAHASHTHVNHRPVNAEQEKQKRGGQHC